MLFAITICYYELLLALLLCYCYYAISLLLNAIAILLTFFAIIMPLFTLQGNNTMTENELKDYIKANKISVSDLRYFMECTSQTLRKRINEISLFSGKDLHILIDFGVPFDIIRKRMKRLYDSQLTTH